MGGRRRFRMGIGREDFDVQENVSVNTPTETYGEFMREARRSGVQVILPEYAHDVSEQKAAGVDEQPVKEKQEKREVSAERKAIKLAEEPGVDEPPVKEEREEEVEGAEVEPLLVPTLAELEDVYGSQEAYKAPKIVDETKQNTPVPESSSVVGPSKSKKSRRRRRNRKPHHTPPSPPLQEEEKRIKKDALEGLRIAANKTEEAILGQAFPHSVATTETAFNKVHASLTTKVATADEPVATAGELVPTTDPEEAFPRVITTADTAGSLPMTLNAPKQVASNDEVTSTEIIHPVEKVATDEPTEQVLGQEEKPVEQQEEVEQEESEEWDVIHG